MRQAQQIPSYADLLWPTVVALRAMGGSGAIAEIAEKVAELEHFTEAQQSVLHQDGPRTEIEYRLAWSRTHLKGMGLLVNSARGVWALSDSGLDIGRDELHRLHLAYRNSLRQARRAAQADLELGADDNENHDTAAAGDWTELLLDALLAMSPAGFERLAQRLLREEGFVSVVVTGRAGDGGIDGRGVYQLSLVSFPVYFQCKRHRGSVGAGDVRDFRGAMVGRGDKGLLISTGSFSPSARREATRDGAPPIDLIDGDRLCDLLKKHNLGVSTRVRQIEEVHVDKEFFQEL